MNVSHEDAATGLILGTVLFLVTWWLGAPPLWALVCAVAQVLFIVIILFLSGHFRRR
jgi:hypothetical protein